jgi:hypothetical protein
MSPEGCGQKNTVQQGFYVFYFVVIIIIFIISGVGLSPLGTAATSGLLYTPQMIEEGDCGAIGGMKILFCYADCENENRIFLLTTVRVTHEFRLKNTVFWDVAPCRSCVNWRFGGMYHLHLQGRKIRERGTSLSRWLQSADEGDTFLRNVGSHKIYTAPHPRRRYSS